MTSVLSKSLFNVGVHCEKRLYLSVHHVSLGKESSDTANRRMTDGVDVGELGRKYFSGGFLVKSTFDDTAEEITDQALTEGVTCLYEAAFRSGESGLSARCDILFSDPNHEGGWHVLEITSSTSVKPEVIKELAFKVKCLTDCGVGIADVSVLHLNNEYVHPTPDLTYDPKQIFSCVNVKTKVSECMTDIDRLVETFREVMVGKNVPDVDTNRHCNDFPCEFYAHCHKDKPLNDVIELPLIRRDDVTKYRKAGYATIDSLPDSLLKNDKWKIIAQVVRTGETYFNSNLASSLSQISYPIHFIDFEGVGSALPLFQNSRTHQQIIFQWSDHILDSPDSIIRHEEFLHRDKSDPRPAFAESLWHAIQSAKTIVIYSPYETTQLKKLAEDGIPYGNECMSKLSETIFDLLKCIKDNVYHKDFHGSYSIKKVLPALVPELSYGEMLINNGDLASLRYLEMVGFISSNESPESIARNLLDYCELDTLAMVKIFENLSQHSTNQH